jgi:hypothetical protein
MDSPEAIRVNLRDPSLQAPAFSVLASLAQAVPTSSNPELNGLPFFSKQDHRLQRDCRCLLCYPGEGNDTSWPRTLV